MRINLKIFSITLLAFLMLASTALAKPSSFQRFNTSLVSKSGSKLNQSIGLRINPFHVIGLAGGPTNAGNLNSGAVMESLPFATKFANVYLPKQIVLNLGVFPKCKFDVALNAPDTCPKGSEIGLKNVNPACATLVPMTCTVYASGLVRNFNSPAGIYLLKTTLTIRLFVAKTDAYGRPASNLLALRVLSPLSGNVIISGKISKLPTSHKFGSKIRFNIPAGLVVPFPGLVSQLYDFNAGIKKAFYAGKPLVKLTKCPSTRRLLFGYNGEFNINGQLGANTTPDNQFKINEVGPVITKKVKC